MTERAPRRRASKRVLRLWAWLAGGLAFLAPFTALGASPKPPSDRAADAGLQRRPVLIVRKITRVVVVREQPAEAPVRYVYAPSGSSSTSSTASTGTTAAASTSTNAAPPPPPPPPTTTSGGS